MTPDRSDSPRAASSKTVAEDSPSPFIELCTGVRADPDQRQTEIYQKLEAIVHSKFFPKNRRSGVRTGTGESIELNPDSFHSQLHFKGLSLGVEYGKNPDSHLWSLDLALYVGNQEVFRARAHNTLAALEEAVVSISHDEGLGKEAPRIWEAALDSMYYYFVQG